MEGRELPEGWATACGSDLFELVTSGSRGWAKYYSDDGPTFIRIGNLDHGSIELDLRDVQHVRPPFSSEGKRTRLEPNDILISITAELGMVALVPVGLGEAYVNQHVALARPTSEIDARFLAWYLASESDGKRQLLEAKRGATKVGLGLPDIRNLILPLAPLNEQRRIAAKLDTTLAAVEACRERLDGVAATLKRFRQAVLAAATSGELTREWREERGIEMDTWKGFEFRNLVSESRTGLVRSAVEQHELQDGLVPYLKMDSIGESWGCNHEGLKAVHCEGAELRTYELAYGDWLFNTRNSLELVGKSCVWKGPAGVVFNNNILRVRFTGKVRPQWVEIYFRSPVGRVMLADVKSATTSVAAIYQRSLMALEIQVPSLEEQTELIDRVETLFTLADQLEDRLTNARQVADRLTPALLAKAFRGELVPQVPNDEPASVLLDRIRAARQAEAGAGKSSWRGRPKAAANPEPINRNAAPVPSEPLPPDLLTQLLRECGALSERALLAVSELEPERFEQQLFRELEKGTAREVQANGQVLLEAVG
jgi:type I restriction enzyme, S subunit